MNFYTFDFISKQYQDQENMLFDFLFQFIKQNMDPQTHIHTLYTGWNDRIVVLKKTTLQLGTSLLFVANQICILRVLAMVLLS